MDFHTLSRKELQTLCKKNKIPANITNVAMADALAALHQVEGLEELLNSREVDAGTPNVRTAVKASTQRKAAREEAEGSKVPVPVSVSKRLQRGARATEGVVEQENKDANVLVTPAPAGSRRRATAVSTRRKKEVEMVDEDAEKNGVQEKPSAVPKTPAAAPGSRRATGRSVCTKIETPSGTSVQRAYSTRRSVRLLEKDLSKMSLVDTEGLVKNHDDVSQDLSNMSQQVEDLSDTEKGSSSQAASTVVSEDTIEIECQSHDSGSDLKLVSVTENDMVVESHGSNEAEPQKVKCLELDAEPHASNEEGSELLEESGDSCEVDTLPVVASEDAILEVIDQDTADVTLVGPDVDVNDQVSNDSDDKEDNDHDDHDVSDPSVSLKELVACNMDDQVIKEGFGKAGENNEPQEEAEPNDTTLKLEGSSDTCDQSDDAGFKVESIGVTQDILLFEASEDAVMEVTDQDSDTLNVVVLDGASDQDVASSLLMSPVNDTPSNTKELEAETEKIDYASDVAATPSVVLGLEKNATCESSVAVMELWTEFSADGIESMLVKNVTPDVEAEDNEDTSENSEAEESEEPAEDDMVETDNAFSSDVVSEDSVHEQKSTDLPVQPVVSDQLKGDVHNTSMMKENVTSNELQNKSIGELRRMLKDLTLGGKSNRQINDLKEVEKKRTALKLLPQNQITADEAQID